MIKLTKNGEITNVKYNENQEEYLDMIFKNEDILSLLHSQNFILEHGFTLRDLFKIFINYPYLQLLDRFLPQYIEDYKKYPPIGCINPSFKYLKISANISYEHDLYDSHLDVKFEKIPNSNLSEMKTTKTLIRKNESKRYSIFYEMSAPTDNIDPLTNKPFTNGYALDMTPLKEILDAPIKIELEDSRVTITEEDNNGDNHHTFDIVEIGGISLFDFINTIINEITFHGYEDDKIKVAEELKRRVDSIDKEIIKNKDISKK